MLQQCRLQKSIDSLRMIAGIYRFGHRWVRYCCFTRVSLPLCSGWLHGSPGCPVRRPLGRLFSAWLSALPTMVCILLDARCCRSNR